MGTVRGGKEAHTSKGDKPDNFDEISTEKYDSERSKVRIELIIRKHGEAKAQQKQNRKQGCAHRKKSMFSGDGRRGGGAVRGG